MNIVHDVVDVEYDQDYHPLCLPLSSYLPTYRSHCLCFEITDRIIQVLKARILEARSLERQNYSSLESLSGGHSIEHQLFWWIFKT